MGALKSNITLDPYNGSLYYMVKSLGEKPVLLDSMPPEKTSDWGNYFTSKPFPSSDNTVVVEVYFKPFEARDGRLLVAYKDTTNQNRIVRNVASMRKQGATDDEVETYLRDVEKLPYRTPGDDPRVQKYMKEVVSSLKLDKAALDRVAKKRSADIRDSFASAFKWLFGGLFVGWLVVLAIGWTVRGFMGIPMGMDRKPTTGEPAQ